MNYIKAERMSMIFGGFYPIRGKKYKALYTLSAVFFMTIASIYNLLGILHGFQHISNVAVFSELITYLLTGVSFSCKMLNLFYHRKNLLTLDDMLRNPLISELQTEEEESIVKSNLKFGQIMKNAYKIYVATTVSVQFLYPLINNSNHKNFPLLLWFPFKPENHYYAVYCFEALIVFPTCYFNVTVDLLNALFMDLSSAQFELLKHRLKQFGTTFTKEQAVDDDEVFEKLREIIVYQNYVYRFVT